MKRTFKCLLIAIIIFAIFLSSCAVNQASAIEYLVLIGENSDIVGKLSDVNLLVIDADHFSSDEIETLKRNGVNSVYSYLNIGSIEDFRPNYSDFSDITLGDYDNWPEEKWVDVSNKQWQDYIFENACELSEKGVDGFFLDNIDVYYYFNTDEIYSGILNILSSLEKYDKKILINGGDCFVRKYYASTNGNKVLFDGVNQETVYSAYDFNKNRCIVNKSEDRLYFTEYLDLVSNNGGETYSLEYADNLVTSYLARRYSLKHGYTYCISDNIELTLNK